MSYRDWPPTKKQLEYIAELIEFSEFPLLKFTGKTRGEAEDYIRENEEIAHESLWAITNGY